MTTPAIEMRPLAATELESVAGGLNPQPLPPNPPPDLFSFMRRPMINFGSLNVKFSLKSFLLR